MTYRYISRRLVETLAMQEYAARPRHGRVVPSVSFPWFGLSYEPPDRKPDRDDRFDLAYWATLAVAEGLRQLGDGSPLSEGDYVLDQLLLAEHLINVRYADGVWRPVATYVSLEPCESGLQLVALVGSAGNVEGHEDVKYAGRVPSDLGGLTDVLNLNRADGEPPIEVWSGDESDALSLTEGLHRSLSNAVSSLEGSSLWSPAEERDVLFVVHRAADGLENVSVRGPDGRRAAVTRIVIGAPIWVTTPAPRPQQGDVIDPLLRRRVYGVVDSGIAGNPIELAATDDWVTDPASSVPSDFASRLDADVIVYQQVRVGLAAGGRLAGIPRSADELAELGRWFVSEAIRSAATPIHVRSSSRRRRGWRRQASTSPTGWFVPSRQRAAFGFADSVNLLVLTDGSIWRGASSGQILGDGPIDVHDEQLHVVVGDVLRAVASMRSPLYGSRHPEPTVDRDGLVSDGRAV